MSFVTTSNRVPAWAANCPAGWRRDWLKWHVECHAQRPSEEQAAELPYISNEDVASWTGELLREDPQPSESEGRVFQREDVLFNKLRPYLAKVYHAEFDGISSGELLCLRSGAGVVPRFLFYVLVSKGFIDTVDAESFGTKMPRADWGIVGHQPLPLPPPETQHRIARFLDAKTARIDTLIAKKRALLERLAEKRQALITQAVTKGLDPGVPMKDSGIDWLGQVPAHWEIKPLRRVILGIEQGWSPAAQDREAAPDEWGILKSGCVNGGRFEPVHKTLPRDVTPIESLEVKGGDVLMCRASGSLHFIGSVAIVGDVRKQLLFSDKTYRLNLDGAKVLKSFFVYTMAAKHLRDQVVLSVSGAEGLANNIAQASVRGYVACFPPLAEQHEITNYVGDQLRAITAIRERTLISVDRLMEYRAALITAAVTGQLEIPAGEPSESPKAHLGKLAAEVA